MAKAISLDNLAQFKANCDQTYAKVGEGGGGNPSIPAPTTADNGKVLGVVDGAYALQEASGGNIELMTSKTIGGAKANSNSKILADEPSVYDLAAVNINKSTGLLGAQNLSNLVAIQYNAYLENSNRQMEVEISIPDNYLPVAIFFVSYFSVECHHITYTGNSGTWIPENHANLILKSVNYNFTPGAAGYLTTNNFTLNILSPKKNDLNYCYINVLCVKSL